MNNINNDEYVYIVFRTTERLVDYDKTSLEIIVILKTEEEANDYITGKNKIR